MLFVSIKNNLYSLIDLLRQLSPSQYNSSCTALSGSSIGSHYRHIIEMFRCLLDKYDEGTVNYDHRPRNRTIETNIEVALQELELLITQIEKPNKTISLEQTIAEERILIESNYYREILHNLDHTIHHQALIKIGISEYDNIMLNDNFGVAPSTVNYRKQNV